MHLQIIAKRDFLLPVRFLDDVRIHAPVTQVRSHTQRDYHPFDFWHQRPDGGVIQVVVMVMGYDQQVDLRHGLCRPRIVTVEGFIQKRERRGVIAQHRIDKNAFPGQLQIPG